jgi:hypothetical protein
MRQANQPTHTRRRRCLSCEDLFDPDPRTKGTQRYCSKETCQTKRQRQNEWAWRLNNPECLEEQREASRQWYKARPGYSRQRRTANPRLLQENRVQTKARMRKLRVKELFDKSKVILTQLAGGKDDKYYLTQGYKWLLVRLTKASLLSRAGLVCDNHRRFKRVAKYLPQGKLYELSGVF